MKVKMYIDLDRSNWQWNTQMAEGVSSSLMATTTPYKLMDGMTRMAFWVDIPDAFFNPEPEKMELTTSDIEVEIEK